MVGLLKNITSLGWAFAVQVVLFALALASVIFAAWKDHRKDLNHQVTGLRQLSVALAVVTFALSIFVEFYKRSKDDLERRARDLAMQTQLDEIRRATYASKIQGVFVEVVYPLPGNVGSRYQARLAAMAEAWRPDVRHDFSLLPGVKEENWNGNKLATVTFSGSSALAPRPSEELDESTTFDLTEVALDFQLRSASSSDDPDSHLQLHASAYDDASRAKLIETFDVAKGEVSVSIPLPRVTSQRTGMIRSAVDLVGAKLKVSLTNTTLEQISFRPGPRYSGHTRGGVALAMRRVARLVTLRMDLADFGTICLTEKDLTRIDDKSITPTYVADLPASFEEFKKKYGRPSSCSGG